MNISGKETNMLKALSALFVLTNHMISWCELESINIFVSELSGKLSDLGMFLFLFISGYGLYKSYIKDNLRGYWDKKIEKIYLPLICANIIGAVACHIVQNKAADRAMIMYGIMSKDFITYNPITWYLHYLFYWYLIFWIIYKFSKREDIRVQLILLGAFSAAMWYFTPETYSLANEYC